MARETLHPRLILAVAAVATAAFVLSGCTTEDPAPVPASDTSPVAPVFASDEEALAAAEEAYAAYQKTSDAILGDGGKEPDRLLEFATKKQYEIELEGYKQIGIDGFHGVGRSRFDTASLEKFDASGGQPVVSVYLCVDISELDVRDRHDKSVVDKDRVDRSPVEVTFDYDGGALLVSSRSAWSGANFCL